MHHKPSMEFFASTDSGLIPVDEEVRAALLPMAPESSGAEAAPVSFGAYFDALEEFLTNDDCFNLFKALEAYFEKPVKPDRIRSVRIVSEKHGAFYHPARIVVETVDGKAVMAANTAFSRAGSALAAREFETLGVLAKELKQPYIPKPLNMGGIKAGEVKADIFLCPWFEGFCEFHASINKDSGQPDVIVWDNVQGHFFPGPSQRSGVYEGAARILGYYYNHRTFQQIYPWHHAAGDFVVRVEKDNVDVRLITVRQYDCMFENEGRGLEEMIEAGLIFLANLSLRMRLDRMDGTGDPAWLGEWSVAPALTGAFWGLQERALEERSSNDFLETLYSVCREMPREYWLETCTALIEACDSRAPDARLMLDKVNEHARALEKAFSKMEKGPFFVDKGCTIS